MNREHLDLKETQPVILEFLLTNYFFCNQDIDRDKDGYVSLDEFLGDYRDPEDAEADEPEWVKEETKKFKEEYDKNKDGKLDKDEVNKLNSLDWLTDFLSCAK